MTPDVRDPRLLLSHGDWTWRAWAARHPEISVADQTILTCDREVEVRLALAVRAVLDVRIARRLAADPATEVRHALACRTDLPDSLLDVLSGDPSVDVRISSHLARRSCQGAAS